MMRPAYTCPRSWAATNLVAFSRRSALIERFLAARKVLNTMTNAMSRAVNQRKVFGALMASFPLAYVVWQTQVHLLGHPSPETSSDHWQAQTRLLNLSKEREGDPEQNILLNPFRTGVPATVRSKEDLPSLEDEE